jgi:hypothetical protein
VPPRTLAPVPSPTATSSSAPPAGTRPGVPAQSRDLLAGSARELLAAGAADDPETRYARAHLAALRASAAVLAARAGARPGQPRRSARVRSAWVLLAEVAPELAEWAAFFAAGAGKRAAAEAGLRGVVTAREADDLVREAETFLALVARALGVAHQPALGADPAAVGMPVRETPRYADRGTHGDRADRADRATPAGRGTDRGTADRGSAAPAPSAGRAATAPGRPVPRAS